jgi:hypothetical protein
MKSYRLALILVILSTKLFSQVNNIRTFQYSYFDIAEGVNNYIESGFLDYESTYLNSADLYYQGSYNLSSNISLGAELKFRGEAFNFDESNTILIAKYNIVNDNVKISIGPYYEVSQGSIGIWGVYRQELLNKLGFITKASLIYESGIFKDNYYTFGVGLIYQLSESLFFVGEGNYTSPMSYPKEFMMISGGLTYNLFSHVSIRGAIGYNIMDTSLQTMINGGLAYSF